MNRKCRGHLRCLKCGRWCNSDHTLPHILSFHGMNPYKFSLLNGLIWSLLAMSQAFYLNRPGSDGQSVAKACNVFYSYENIIRPLRTSQRTHDRTTCQQQQRMHERNQFHPRFQHHRRTGDFEFILNSLNTSSVTCYLLGIRMPVGWPG